MQPAHRVSDGLEHPLHLVLAALVERELDPSAAEPAGAGGRGAAVLELDAVAKPAKRVLARIAFDLGLVDLLHLVARVREPVCELPVVRQQERAGRVRVEPADRDDARHGRDELDDGRPPVRVARRRHDAGGLVEQHVGEPLRYQRPPVELDRVGGLDDRVQLPGPPVHADTARLDQRVGAAARGDAGPCEVGVEPHGRYFPLGERLRVRLDRRAR